jgi:hypothetical protein
MMSLDLLEQGWYREKWIGKVKYRIESLYYVYSAIGIGSNTINWSVQFVLRGNRRSTDAQPDLVNRIISTLLQMYLDLPTDREPLNIPYLESALRSQTFEHIYRTYAIRSIPKNPTAPITRQSTRMNTRERREVVHPDLMRLHVLLAPDWDHENIADRKMRGWLREIVYSGSNYGEWNDWGPFDKEGKGTVDWGVLDAIGSVMSMSSNT